MKWVRWWLVFSGGMLIGAGLLLHGEVAMAEHLRSEGQGVFFLWRGIAQMTFIFHDDLTQTSLFLADLPDHVFVESNRLGWTLTIIGLLLVVAAPQVRKRRKRRRRGSIG